MSQTVRCIKNARSSMDYKVKAIQRRMDEEKRLERESEDRITSRAKWLDIMDWLHKVKLPPKTEWSDDNIWIWDPNVYKYVKRRVNKLYVD